MGDCQTEPLRPQFDRRLRLRFLGAKVTSDAGLLAYRELDDALDLTRSAASELHDSRTGRNARHSITALLRQSVYSRLAGYTDLNDAELDSLLTRGHRADYQELWVIEGLVCFQLPTSRGRRKTLRWFCLRCIPSESGPFSAWQNYQI